jgi:nitroreductase
MTTEINVDAIKAADPDYPILELIAERWSPRAYSNRAVEPEKLRSILEAARWAESSGNGQPWAFFIAPQSDPDNYAKMVDCLAEGNVSWASQAPVLGMAVTALVRANGKPNRHGFYDAGLAMQNLALQATAEGLRLRQMGGFRPETARSIFAIPETHEAVVMFALGYQGDPAQLAEKQREQELTPRVRRPVTEFVFGETWGKTNPLVADDRS